MPERYNFVQARKENMPKKHEFIQAHKENINSIISQLEECAYDAEECELYDVSEEINAMTDQLELIIKL